jgi:hypothetical protein
MAGAGEANGRNRSNGQIEHQRRRLDDRGIDAGQCHHGQVAGSSRVADRRVQHGGSA